MTWCCNFVIPCTTRSVHHKVSPRFVMVSIPESVAVFVEVPKEQKVISLINRLYHEDGVAPAEIARRINDHGYTKRNGKPWDNKQVTRLIVDYDRVYNTTSAVVDKGIEFLKALP